MLTRKQNQYGYRAVFALIAMLVPVCLYAKEDVARQSLILYTNPLPFFSYLDTPDKLDGYSVQLSRAIANQAGYKVKATPTPWARIENIASQQAQVLIAGIVRTAERERDYHWITPISEVTTNVFTLGQTSATINSFEQVAKLGAIGALRGDYRHQLLLESINEDSIVAYNSWESAVMSLLLGRIQGLFFSDVGVTLVCLEHQLKCENIQRSFTYKTVTSYIAIPVSSEEENAKLAAELLSAADVFKSSPAFANHVDSFMSQSGIYSGKFVNENGVMRVAF